MIKKTAAVIFTFSIILCLSACAHTKPVIPMEQKPLIQLDKDACIKHLSNAVKLPTVADADKTKTDLKPFFKFIDGLEKDFPLIHKNLKKEMINNVSLLYIWQGSDRALEPVILMGHIDVVPVEAGTEKEWKYPPFSGVVAEDAVWGRGTLDDKGDVISKLEAVETLLRQGYKPKRTIYLAFGADEEVSGESAKAITEGFKSGGVNPAIVVDEGGSITEGIVPVVANQLAVIGIAEKGFVNLSITAISDGGHSSTPPKETAVAILSAAILKVTQNPFPANLDSSKSFFEPILPYMPFFQRTILGNTWLFKPLIVNTLSKNPATNAVIRTTTAPTMLNASPKPNVLPVSACAVINFRIIPGETPASVKERVEKLINDKRVKVEIMGMSTGPSRVSDTDSKAYQILCSTIKQVSQNKDLIVAPYLMLAASDARHYSKFSKNVYRFSAFIMRKSENDLQRVHGTNERIYTAQFINMIEFNYLLIRNLEDKL